MRIRRAPWSMAFVFSLVIVGLCIAAIEGMVRLATPPPGFVSSGQAVPGLLTPHPQRSYAYAPGFTGSTGRGDEAIHIAINALGLRDDEIAPGEVVDVLALGDSFTAGWGVEAVDAWPTVLEVYLTAHLPDRRPTRVLNGGVSGYNLRQIRLLLEEMIELEPRLVVLGLPPSKAWRLANPYVYFDGQAVLESVSDGIRVKEGGYVHSTFEGPRLQRVDFWLMEHLHAGAYALRGLHRLSMGWSHRGATAAENQAPSSTQLEPLLAELDLVHGFTRARGIPLVVMLVNHQEPDGAFDAQEKESNAEVTAFCRQRGIAVLDPLPKFEEIAVGSPCLRQGADFHWSRLAHVTAGQELGAFLLTQENIIW